MTITARKLAHIRTMTDKTFIGRDQKVTLTLRTPTGGTTTLTVNAIWRIQIDGDPTLEGATNSSFHVGTPPDIFGMFNQEDITYQQLRACIWLELPAGSLGTQLATRYVLLDVEPIGIPPGGDRYFTKWTRQH